MSRGRRPKRRGAIVVLCAILLPIMLIFAAFAINLAYMHLAKTELRVATDAAARAGGRTLSISQSVPDARAAAIEGASRNQVAITPLQLADADIEFGVNTIGSGNVRAVFTPGTSTTTNINAVRVTGRRTAGSLSGSVPLFLPGITGRGAFEPIQRAVAMQVDRDIGLIVDRSGSMTWRVDRSGGRIPPSGSPVPADCRWLALVDAVDAFLDALTDTIPDEQVAMASYASTASLDHDLTMDYSTTRDCIDGYTQSFPGGATNIGGGLRTGVEALMNQTTARPFAFRTIVVMTDGVHNTGEDPETVAQWARDTHGVTIHTITFSVGAAQQRMQQVAEIGGGQHWHATDTASLVDAFVEIANNTPTVLTE